MKEVCQPWVGFSKTVGMLRSTSLSINISLQILLMCLQWTTLLGSTLSKENCNWQAFPNSPEVHMTMCEIWAYLLSVLMYFVVKVLISVVFHLISDINR